MANAEEMLAQALAGDTAELSDENQALSVDWNTRTIHIPSNMKCLGVESDDDVTRVEFVMPKSYCDIDLSEFSIHINYLNAKGQGDVYRVRDTVVDGELVTFSWLVGRNALVYEGVVKFNICLKKMDAEDPSVVVQELNTTIASLPVLKGLETSEAIIQKYADILVQWEQELDNRFNSFVDGIDKKISSGIDSYFEQNPVDEIIKEDLDGAVNNYFDKNPVDTVTDEELRSAIDEYFLKNPVDTVTEQELKEVVNDYFTANPPTGISDEMIKDAIEAYFIDNPIEGGTADSISWEKITDKPDTFPPDNHEHSYNDLKDKPDIPIVPDSLPNPHSLIINGKSYDGSESVEMTIETVDLDNTLKEAGKAADASAVGTALSELKNEKVDKAGWTASKNVVTGADGKVTTEDKPTIPTIPSALPNPFAVTINGQSYDGSKEVDMTVSGLPDGGTAGQVLTKKSETDGDAEWADPSGGLQMDVLWFNPDLSSSFPPQVAEVDYSGYDEILVVCHTSTTTLQRNTPCFVQAKNGARGVCTYVYFSSNAVQVRYREVYVVENGVEFEDAYNNASASSGMMIPTEIYGIKGVGNK